MFEPLKLTKKKRDVAVILIEFVCSTDVLKKIIESESGFFKKSSETIESLSLEFFKACKEFCDLTYDQPQEHFVSYASCSIDCAIRTTNTDPINLIQFRDSGSALDARIMEDWLVKNKDRAGFSPRFICFLGDGLAAESVIEPILEAINIFRGSVFVSACQDTSVSVSAMEYPAFRLDGAVIGGSEYNYSLENISSSLLTQLESIEFFKNATATQTKNIETAAKPKVSSDRKQVPKPSQPSTKPNMSGSFDVIIDRCSVNTVEAIKSLRRVLGLGLREAKDIADNLPVIIERDLGGSRANKLKDDLEADGFSVTLTSLGSLTTNTGGSFDSEQSSGVSNIDPTGVTILSCDIEVFGFRNEQENLSESELAKLTIKTVGLEVENSLSSSEPPYLIVYDGAGASLIPYEEASDADIASSLDMGSVNIAVKDLTGHDWESALVYMSGDANARILAIGYHPSFDNPVRQIYDCGELDTGIVEDRDLDLYGSDDVANMFNEFLRI